MRAVPESLRRALADSLDLDGANMGWQLPARMPCADDIRAGLKVLEARLTKAQVELMQTIIAKLADTYPSYGQMSELQEENRANAWMDANGDLPNELWVEAYFAAIKHPFKRMPSPGEFREFVKEQFSQREHQLQRARWLLAKATETEKKPAPPPPPRTIQPRDVVLRSCKAMMLRVGSIESAQRYENELAALEGRAREILTRATAVPKRTEATYAPTVPIKPRPENAATLKRALARKWRAQGADKMADRLEREAQALWPLDDRGRPIDSVPEAG